LEGLVTAGQGQAAAPLAVPQGVQAGRLSTFLAGPDGTPLSEEAFVALPTAVLVERTNVLLELCRSEGKAQSVPAIENFVVFFQTLLPTLAEDGAREIRRVFFRLAPTLIHFAYNDFSDDERGRQEGFESLRNLESILIEISSVRLAPTERDLVFRSIDQMTAFIGAGEYTMANEIISSQLLSIIARNKMTRALYRLMEVEVNVQVFLKEKLGYLTPQIKVPDDFAALADYGPIRVLLEDHDGEPRRYIQIHIPGITSLRDLVLELVSPIGESHTLRLDAVGSAELTVPDGEYKIGVVYQPES
jgi:hypothetical protein